MSLESQREREKGRERRGQGGDVSDVGCLGEIIGEDGMVAPWVYSENASKG